MAERKIEIQMAAVGAAEAATQIGQTAGAVDQLAAADARAQTAAESSGSLSDRIEKLKDRAAATKELAEEQVAEEKVNADSAAARNRQMRDAGLALGGVAAAVQFTRASLASLAEAAAQVDLDKLTRVDPAAAENLKQILEVAEATQNPLKTVVELWERMLIGGYTAAEEVAKINEAIVTGETVHAEIIEGILQRGIVQAEALKNMASEIAAANSIMDAKDGADAAADKRADARKIRDGADPYTVEQEAAQREADRNIARLEREQKARESAAAAASSNADQASRNATRIIENPAASAADITRAGTELEQASIKAADAVRTANTAAQITEEKIRAERERAAARVEAAQAAQAAREQDIIAKHAEQNIEDEISDQRAAEKRDAAAESARRNQTRGTAGAAMGIADGAERAGATSSFVDALRNRAAAAQADPSAANSAALAKMLDQLLTAIERGKAGDATEAANLKRRITALERREKNR